MAQTNSDELDLLRGIDVSVFSLDTTELLATIRNVDINVDPKTEDASSVADVWEVPTITKKGWSIDYEANIARDAGNLHMLEAINDGAVDVVVNTGAGTYTGRAVITKSGHNIKNGALQSVKVTLQGRGALALALA